MLSASGNARFASERSGDTASRPERTFPSYLGFAIGTLALLILAGCGGGSSSSCSGGGGGYTSDNLPQLGMLDSCSSSGSMGSGATSVDPNNHAALNAALSMSVGSTPLYYYSGVSFPAAGASAVTIALSGQTSGDSAMSVGYTVTIGGTGTLVILYCHIQGVSPGTYYNISSLNATASTTRTLTVKYPMFSTSGSFTLECVGNDGSADTSLTSIAGS